MSPLFRDARAAVLAAGVACLVLRADTPVLGQIVAPSAKGKVLYEDRLNEGWASNTGSSCRSRLGDGGLILSTFAETSSYCAWALWAAGTFDTDVRIELTVRLRQGPANQDFGLAFGLNEARPLLTWSIVTSGAYRLDYLEKGVWHPLIEVAADPIVKTGLNVSNRLGVEIRGRHLKAFVNGKAVGEAETPFDVAGSVGLYLNNSNMEAVFNDLRVTALSEPVVDVPGEWRTVWAAKKGAGGKDLTPRAPADSSQAALGPKKPPR